ncbi:MAG: HAD-IA family hydrolase [Alphaproteobacteria bacterium]|nr:HAD-IA family hydrolase [Alphaproteobacteria bacterium]
MRLVVFDLDGTLVNSGAHIGTTMSATFVEAGLPVPTPQDIAQIIGLSLELAVARLGGLAGTEIDRVAAIYRRLYHQSIASAGSEPLFEGVHEVLDRLSAEPGTLLGIATGKGLRGVRRIIELHGLGSRFVTIQTPDDNPSKPHPGMLDSAMRETGIAPERTVMVGDTSFDMEMARAAGCCALGVTWGSHTPRILRTTGAQAIVTRVGNLDAAINSLVKAEQDA